MITPAMLKLVAPEWHDEFRKYVRTGEASPMFLSYLDRDADCDRAVDLAVAAMVRGLAEKPAARSAKKRKRVKSGS